MAKVKNSTSKKADRKISKVAQKKQVLNSLYTSDEISRILESTITDVIWTLDMDLNFTYISPSCERLLGYTPEEEAKVGITGILTPASMERINQAFTKAIAAEPLLQKQKKRAGSMIFELEQIRKDGSTVWTEVRMSFMRDVDEKPIGIAGITCDITSRKELEKELRVKETAIEQSLHATFISDMEGTITYVNQACLKLWGSDSKEDLVGKPYWLLLSSEDMVTEIRELMLTTGSWQGEISTVRKDGKEILLLASSNVMTDEEGNAIQTIFSFIDITERKRTEKALHESEAELATLVGNLTDAVFKFKDGKLIWGNDRIVDMAGYPKDDFFYADVSMFMPDDKNLPQLYRDVSRGLKKDGTFQGITRVKRKDGSLIDIEYSGAPIPGKVPMELVGVARDITERKQVEAAVKEAEQRYNAIFNNRLQLVFIHDGTGKFIDANDIALEKLGWTREELEKGQINFNNIIHPDDVENAYKSVMDIIETGVMKNSLEYRLFARSGEILWIETYQIPLEITSEKYIAIGLATDITERKKAEEAIRNQEKFYRRLTEKSSDGILLVDARGTAKFGGPSFMRLLGYGEEEGIGTSAFDYIHPDDLNIAIDGFKQIVSDPTVSGGMELRVKHKDGSWHWLEVIGTNYLDDPAVGGIVFNFSDITTRKEADDALKAKERYFRAIMDLSSEAMLLVNSEGNIIDTSNGLERISGYTREMTLGGSATDFIHPDDWPQTEAAFTKAFENPGQTVHFEARLKHADGHWQWTGCMISNLLDHPDVRGVVTHLMDITERKQIEDALKTREEFYRLLTEKSPEGTAIIDAQGALVYKSPSLTKILGFGEQDDLGKSAFDWIHPEDASIAVEALGGVIASPGMSGQVEFRVKHKDGEWCWIEATATNHLEDSAVKGIVVNLRDITERKKVEEALRESEQQIKEIFDNVNDFIFLIDKKGKYLNANRRSLDIFGIPPESMIGHHFGEFNYLPPESLEKVTKAWSEAMARGDRMSSVEVQACHTNGHPIIAECAIQYLTAQNGEITGYIGMMRDSTERVEAQRSIREREKRFREIFENVADVIIYVDNIGTVININQRAMEIVGRSPDDLIGRNIFEFNIFSEEQLLEINTLYAECIAQGKAVAPVIECTIIHTNGSEVMTEIKTSMVTDENNNLAGFLSIIRDVTQQKKAQEAVKQSEYNLKKAQELAHVGSYEWNLVTGSFHASDEMCHIYGINHNSDQATTAFIGSTVYPEDIPIMNNAIEELITGANQKPFEYRIVKPDGDIRWISATKPEIKSKNETGNAEIIVGSIQDVTDHKHAEMAMARNVFVQDTINELLSVSLHARSVEVLLYNSLQIILNLNLPNIINMGAAFDIDTHTGELILKININLPETLQTICSRVPLGHCMCGRAAQLGKTVSSASLDENHENDCEGIKSHSHHIIPIMVDDKVRAVITLFLEAGTNLKPEDNELLMAASDVISGALKRISAENELNRSQKRFKQIFESASDEIIYISNDGTVENVNQRSFDIFGYTPEEIIGHNIMELNIFGSEELERISTMMSEANRTNAVMQDLIEVVVQHKDGHTMYAEASTRAVTDEDDHTINYLCLLRDITERKEIERAIRESETQYRLLAENINDVISIMDFNLNYIYLSPSIERLRGYTIEEVKAQKPEETMTKESLERLLSETMNHWMAEMAGDKNQTRIWLEEIEVLCKNGTTKWVDMTMSFLRDENGNATGLLASAHEVTERHYTQEALKQRTQQILAVQKIIASIQSTMEIKQVLQIISEAVLQSLGFDHSLIMLIDESKNVARGAVFNTSTSIDTISSIEDIINQAITAFEIPMERGLSNAGDRTLDRKENITHKLSDIAQHALTPEESDSIQEILGIKTIATVPMATKDKLVGVLIVFASKDNISDIDMESLWLLADQAGIAIDNVQLNQALEARVAERTLQLETTNKELESFAYSLAHDLRTPLRGIDGFGQVLLEDYSNVLDEEGQSHLQRIRTASQRMSRIIDDILHLLRLTRTEMHIDNINLSQLARSISEEYKEREPNRNVKFIISPDLHVQADGQMMREVLDNLIGNAWKFSSRQENAVIEFGCLENNGINSFFVRDNGVGFDIKYADKLFHPFQRLHSPKDFDSAGIGLATIQRIIGRHKGQVWAEGAVDKGATFYFTL